VSDHLSRLAHLLPMAQPVTDSSARWHGRPARVSRARCACHIRSSAKTARGGSHTVQSSSFSRRPKDGSL